MPIQKQTIDDFFDFKRKNDDGSFRMYEVKDSIKDRLYILNKYHKKLVQLIVNDEPIKKDILTTSAQIKIIPYVVKRTKVYGDKPDDPHLFQIYKDLELTYHGGELDDKTQPKIHLKVKSKSKSRYRTLVDCSLHLDDSIPRPAPLFSFFPGFEYDKNLSQKIKKKSHKFQINSDHPIRIDFYLSGRDLDFHVYMNSMYSINMFHSLDFLIAKDNCPLQGLPIVQPITIFAMKNYNIWVRCSRSRHIGKPTIQFYNNMDYYYKIMDRKIAYPNQDGSLTWKTMMQKELEITEELADNNLI